MVMGEGIVMSLVPLSYGPPDIRYRNGRVFLKNAKTPGKTHTDLRRAGAVAEPGHP